MLCAVATAVGAGLVVVVEVGVVPGGAVAVLAAGGGGEGDLALQDADVGDAAPEGVVGLGVDLDVGDALVGGVGQGFDQVLDVHGWVGLGVVGVGWGVSSRR